MEGEKLPEKYHGGDFFARAWQSGSIWLSPAPVPLVIAGHNSIARVRRDDACPRPFASRTLRAATKCEHEASPSPDSRETIAMLIYKAERRGIVRARYF